uniref:Uncharacterized protein n=1 Tax=Megaselia scalaris TaxID=36166 RepID=T1GK82_MEGSC
MVQGTGNGESNTMRNCTICLGFQTYLRGYLRKLQTVPNPGHFYPGRPYLLECTFCANIT